MKRGAAIFFAGRVAGHGGRLADRAYSRIVEIIKADSLDVGDRLPSEAQLAATFGMSRAVVREALVRLASDGITVSRRGAGSYVTRRPSERLDKFMPLDDLSVTLGSYEVRFVLEAEAARLAAVRRSPEQMDAIEEAWKELRSALLSNGPAHQQDMALHRAIAMATTNSVFVSTFDHMFNEVERIMRAGVDISRSRPPEVIGAMLAEHDSIVEAIRLQDPDGAAVAMRWHLMQGRRRLMP
jgi:DNA-binding FadR family transcriptional regulator